MEPLEKLLEEALGRSLRILGDEAVGGGCINDARRVRTPDGDLFVKRSSAREAALLDSEAAGLQALRETGTVRVPAVIGFGRTGGSALLALEWIDLHPLDARSGARLGERLAALHGQTQPGGYGWERDNFIGSTPQPNGPLPSWPEFFRERRLRVQLELAAANGHGLPSAHPLLEGIGKFFPEPPPGPAPLHGDLWGGNAAADSDGDPVLFDPAFYRGDPEADLAFTRFFGGFPDAFRESYHAAIKTRPGWKIRETLYNLYHVLNHLNLFGTSYLGQARRMIEELNERAR